jgi:ring-1,2-phenylacetyl-CoA epoxidase subunit PaaD
MVNERHNEQDVWKALAEVSDPEIPVLSVVDMKIISRVEVTGDNVSVEITPTFVGCPALEHIKDQIRLKLSTLGFEHIQVQANYSKPWSTDLLENDAREKLRAFGVAPPVTVQLDLSQALAEPVACPFCNSQKTHIESPFGPTLCKQIFYCDSCLQSFERFKPL